MRAEERRERREGGVVSAGGNKAVESFVVSQGALTLAFLSLVEDVRR